MTGRNPLRAVLLGSCAFMFPHMVLAQGGDPLLLETITIESKRDVQTDTATAVTEIDQEEIDDRQAGTIAELIDSVPGVTLINGSTPVGGGINIRGFGAGNTYGSNQKVLIMVDGATQGSEELYRIGTQLFTDPELYKTVSVLRGTVGSFEYGSGVVGGLVQLETKDASDFTGGEIGYRLRQALSFSSNGDGITSSTILAWQPSEDFEVMANYVWRRQGEQDDGAGNNTGDVGFKEPSYGLKAKYSFGQDRDQYVSLSYTDSTIAERDVPYDAVAGLPFGNVDRDIRSRTLVLAYGWNPADNDLVDLSVNLSYADQKIYNAAIGPGFPLIDADHRYETTKLTVKNTAHFSIGGVGNELRAGAELIFKDRLDAYAAPGGNDDRIALFAIDEMDFGNGFTLTPALRYETQNITYKGGNPAFEGEYDNDALMGGISARYEWQNGFAVFASGAYTESLPIMDDFDRQTYDSDGNIINYMTTTEKARTWEIGASHRQADVFTADDAISLKANLYKTHVWDITSEPNVSTADLKGLELEGAYSHATGFYGEISANIVDYKSATIDGVWRDYYAQTPADSARLVLGKRWDRELDLSWEMVASRRYDRGDVDAPIPGTTVHNLRATYRPATGILEGTELRFAVENLFDKEYERRLATRNAPGRNIKFALAKTF